MSEEEYLDFSVPPMTHATGGGVVKDLKVMAGSYITQGTVILIYKNQEDVLVKFKSKKSGRVHDILVNTGDSIQKGTHILKISGGCTHPTVMKDMCAECGADLKDDDKPDSNSGSTASVAMVHSIPELKVSTSEATNLGKEDQKRLLKDRKLVLLVDLDQTLIHTTNDNIPPNLRDVFHFQLYGSRSPWYHTRIRPRTMEFLGNLHSLYELHICTFGARMYAHKIAAFLDPEGKYFSHRILSRDECFDNRSKTANMSALFPCGDSMACIIDDREDVWNYAPNLVHVKPYHFFKHTGDINAPPGLSKQENDDKEGVDFDKIVTKKPKAEKNDEKEDKPENENDDKDAKNVEKATTEDKTDEKVEKAGKEDESKPSEKEEKQKEKQKAAVCEKEGNGCIDEKGEGEEVKDDLELSDSEEESENSAKQEDGSVVKNDVDKKDVDLIDVEDSDDYLFYLEDILKTIHKAYYDLYDQMKEDKVVPDLKTVVPYVKRKVLQGVNIVLSGVVPTQVPVHKSKPYLLAKSLGASVFEGVDENTTHLVAARTGTAKVNEAKKNTGICIVTPDWLWACAERWARVDESLFKLGKSVSVTMKPPAHCSSPEIAFAERCAEIDVNEGYSKQHSVAENDPFLAFSTDDLKGMDAEIEDVLSGESDEDSSEDDNQEDDIDKLGTCIEKQVSSSDSEESMTTDDAPRGHKRKSEDVIENENLNQDDDDSNFERPYAKLFLGEEVPSDFEIDEGDDEEHGAGEDWSVMGALLEREMDSEH